MNAPTLPMELSSALLDRWQLVAGGLLFAGALLLALYRMPWYWLCRGAVLNRYAAACAAVLAVWQIEAHLAHGPALHLLGATLLTLAFGWQLALTGMALVLLTSTAAGGADWPALGINGSLLAVFAVGLSYGIARASERWLPAHLFVYLFAAAFFGAGAVMALTCTAGAIALLVAAEMSRHAVLSNYLPACVLLVFPEAFLTGALVTLAAVYRPHWLVSFDDRRYLGNGP